MRNCSRSTPRWRSSRERDPVKVRLVELRYFAGLTGEEAAEVLGISARTADRYWVYARAWLRSRDGRRKLQREN